MAKPTISVIMGVYNPDRRMLRSAVQSILDQKLPDLEFVICDDGSDDDTYHFLCRWADRDTRLCICRHEKNRGLAAALNTCIAQAGGRYIARQDADDYSQPERLAKQVIFLEKNPEYAFAGCNVVLFDDEGEWGTMRFPEQPENKDFLFSLPFRHGTLVFRADVLRQFGGYKVSRWTTRTEDYELLARMYIAGARGYNMQESYYWYREDKINMQKRRMRHRFDEAVVKASAFHKMGLLPKAIPYVIKPVVVGLIPLNLLTTMKKSYYQL